MRFPALARSDAADVAVVGSGVSAVMTTFLAQSQGLRTLLLSPGLVQPEPALGHVTTQPTRGYRVMCDRWGRAGCSAYAMACRSGIDLVEQIVTRCGWACGFARTTTYLVALEASAVAAVAAEVVAASGAGLRPTLEPDLRGTPFETAAAAAFGSEAQVDTAALVNEAAGTAITLGASIHEATPVDRVERVSTREGRRWRLHGPAGESVVADHVVITAPLTFAGRSRWMRPCEQRTSRIVLESECEGLLPRRTHRLVDGPVETLRAIPTATGNTRLIATTPERPGDQTADDLAAAESWLQGAVDAAVTGVRHVLARSQPTDGRPYIGGLGREGLWMSAGFAPAEVALEVYAAHVAVEGMADGPRGSTTHWFAPLRGRRSATPWRRLQLQTRLD